MMNKYIHTIYLLELSYTKTFVVFSHSFATFQLTLVCIYLLNCQRCANQQHRKIKYYLNQELEDGPDFDSHPHYIIFDSRPLITPPTILSPILFHPSYYIISR
jgi:hypothetical protein